MKIKNKILLALLITLLFSGITITSIWYGTSQSLMDTYLKNMSESTMRDAYHAFEYLLTDTSYMATLISTNGKNIIEPISNLNRKELRQNGQWNKEYLENRRSILDYIKGMIGYKYYISGITVAANEDCIFATSAIIQDKETLYREIQKLNQERLETSMVMMDPIHLEGLKYTVSSDYVVPAVRGIVDANGNLAGYVILYFDYGVIDKMFSANLPEGSYFQVVNEQGSLIFSNCGDDTSVFGHTGQGYAYHTFLAENVGWNFHMAIPSHFYISGIRQTALLSGGVISAILLAAGIISGIFISRMTTEITVLSEHMNKVSEGHMDTQYHVISRDEIGQMGHAFNHMVVRIRELMQKISEEERDKRRSEIAFLQAQINPHFISNVLNNAAWMAGIRHADNIVLLLRSLNSLLQNAMHAEEDLIKLSDELDYVDNYLTIMEYSGSYDFYVEKDIEEPTKSLYIPRFILQPIVENAIYHGLPEDLSKQGCIKISAWAKGEHLHISIEDNGAGISLQDAQQILVRNPERRKSFNGIGVPNVNERIRLFFGEEYGLHYESEPGQYTKCIFLLPVVKEVQDGNHKTGIGR